MTNLDSIFKSRDITLPTKVRLVKAMVFPVVMYECESWTVKKAEHQRIDAFELWCWRELLRVPWTARWSSQSILKEISPGCSLEGMMLNWSSSTLDTSSEELTHWKNSDAGRDWRQEEKGTTQDEMAGWHHGLDGCESEWTLGVGDGHGGLACCNSWGRKESDTTERLNWTEDYLWVLLQNWGPTQVEYDNFKLRTRFLKHHSVVSPPSNQKKTTHIAALILKVAFSFWSLMMIILLGLLFGPCLIYDKVQQFQAKLLLLGGCMLVSGWIPWLRSDRERLLLC